MGDNRLVKVAIVAGMACSLLAASASAQSLGDRFKSLFGGKSDEPATAAPGAPAVPEDTRRPDLSAGCGPGRRIHLCGSGARQAGGRQRSAVSGNHWQDGPRMQRQRRHGHRADRYPGARHCRVPPARRPRSRFRSASPWCRAACRRKPSPPRPTRPPSTCRNLAASLLPSWPRIWFIRRRPVRLPTPTFSTSASTPSR